MSDNNRRQRSAPARFKDFIVNFEVDELQNKASPTISLNTKPLAHTDRIEHSTRHTRFLDRMKNDTDRYSEFRRQQNERNRAGRKQILTKPLAIIEAYREKARQRSAKNLDILRQTPDLYQQYLNKKRDEKRRRRGAPITRKYNYKTNLQTNNKLNNGNTTLEDVQRIKEEPFVFQPKPESGDINSFIKTEYTDGDLSEINSNILVKNAKEEKCFEVQSNESQSLLPIEVVIKQEEELLIDDSYL